jgi:hypothetical protein
MRHEYDFMPKARRELFKMSVKEVAFKIARMRMILDDTVGDMHPTLGDDEIKVMVDDMILEAKGLIM